MKNAKILEMIHAGKIEELTDLLKEEIYTEEMGHKGNLKRRYAAMKRYFKYSTATKEQYRKPCENVSFNGCFYNSFTDGITAVLTTEGIGWIEPFNEKKNGKYFDISKIFDIQNRDERKSAKMDLKKIIAFAKSNGYSYKKKEVSRDMEWTFAVKLFDGVFSIGKLEQAFSIIDDGNIADCSYINRKSPLMFQTSVGMGLTLPIYYTKNINDELVCHQDGKIFINGNKLLGIEGNF